MNDEKNSWMGKKGFDEAYYYEDKKSDIGITHSDPTIIAKVTELLERNFDENDMEIMCKDGHLTLSGPETSNKDKIIAMTKEISGVKSVVFLVKS